MPLENITVDSFFHEIGQILGPAFILFDLLVEHLHTILNLALGRFLFVIDILSNILIFTDVGHSIIEFGLIKVGLVFETKKLIVFGFVLKEDVSETLLESRELFNSCNFTKLLDILEFAFIFVLHQPQV